MTQKKGGRGTDAIACPACIVIECCKHESGVLVRLCFCRHGYQDDEERDQGRPQCGVPHRGQDLAVAIEQEAKGIDDLVCTDDVFGLNNARYTMGYKHIIDGIKAQPYGSNAPNERKV